MAKVKDQDYKKWAREIASGGAVVFFWGWLFSWRYRV